MTRCPNDEQRAFKTMCGLELCEECNFKHLEICNECSENYMTTLLFDLMRWLQ